MKSILRINEINYRIGQQLLFACGELQCNASDYIHLQGPSGVGKSLFGLSLIGVFADKADVKYSLQWDDDKGIDEKEGDFRHVRKHVVGYIFQQPRSYFNPVLTCGEQLREVIAHHPDQNSFILNWCDRLKIKGGNKIFKAYPHEYSIGELQRIYVISALIRNPQLLIADEPFAHLDWPTAKIVAKVIRIYIEDEQASCLMISHEPSQSLFAANRNWIFAERKVVELKIRPKANVKPSHTSVIEKAMSRPDVLKIDKVSKSYPRLFGFRKKGEPILSQISFDIKQGDRIGIMGTSGSGKTTLAQICAGLLPPSEGDVHPATSVDFNWKTLYKRASSPIQFVFQDPFSSFNDKQSIGAQILQGDNKTEALRLLSKLNLPKNVFNRGSRSLSGGELQRLAILRALTIQPHAKVLILDEALSALDIDNQLIIRDILAEEYQSLAVIFVSHRFNAIQQLCHSVLFLVNGSVAFHMKNVRDDVDLIPKSLQSLIETV